MPLGMEVGLDPGDLVLDGCVKIGVVLHLQWSES